MTVSPYSSSSPVEAGWYWHRSKGGFEQPFYVDEELILDTGEWSGHVDAFTEYFEGEWGPRILMPSEVKHE